MIQSIQRAISILDCMKSPDKTYSIKELSNSTSLSASTVHRILATLVQFNYVTHDEITHNYKLGPALISLGIAATHNTKLQEKSTSILKRLSMLTQEDSFLMIKAGNKGIVIQKEQGPNNLKVVENFGYEISLHWGAIRKVLLAYQSEEFIQNYIKTEFKPTPTHMALNPDKLIQELDLIRQNKVAVSVGDYIHNGIGVGAPVFDYTRKVIASIGIIATTSRVNKNNLDKIVKTVSKCANELSSLMGYN